MIEFENTVPVTVKLIARTLVPTGINSPEVTVDRDATTDDLTAAGYVDPEAVTWILRSAMAEVMGRDDIADDERFGTDADHVLELLTIVLAADHDADPTTIVEQLDTPTRSALQSILSDRVIS